MSRFGLMVAIAALVLAACGGDSGLEGTSWELFAYDTGLSTADALPGTEAPIAFEADTVVGSDGCNGFNGPYEVTGDNAITIGPLASTLRACEPDVMAQADAVIAIVSDATEYEIDAGQLTLRTADGRFAVYFEG